jgi:uncharacterized glyoxalase superfamily protein PhnB
MDYETYKKKFYADPSPKPRYNFTGAFGSTLFYEDYQAAITYYEKVLGPPAYIEGEGTRGWRIGGGWLTLFQGKSRNPTNVEITFVVATPEEAEALQHAFIEAGGEGSAPSDELMYEPIRFCAVTDPFGVGLLVISPLLEHKEHE